MKTTPGEERVIKYYSLSGAPVYGTKKIQHEQVVDTAPQVIVVQEVDTIVKRRQGRDVDEEQATPRQTPTSGGKTTAPPCPDHEPMEKVVRIDSIE